MTIVTLIRTGMVAMAFPALLAACASTAETTPVAIVIPEIRPDATRYAVLTDEPFPVIAVPSSQLKPQYMRQLVDDPTGQPPGTIVVDPKNRYLYLVQQGGKALRYGVGVGREGMAWSGTATIAYKRQWPRWTPTQDMIAREPGKYQKWANGMDGGDRNPPGARAMYLFEGARIRSIGFTERPNHGRSARQCRRAVSE